MYLIQQIKSQVDVTIHTCQIFFYKLSHNAWLLNY